MNACTRAGKTTLVLALAACAAARGEMPVAFAANASPQSAADTATNEAARSAADAAAQEAKEEGQEVAPEPKGYWKGPMNGPVPATITGGKVIRLPELLTLLKRGMVVSVDVSNMPKRPEGMSPSAPWMPLPQQVIPGSVWIPGAGLATIEPAIDTLFRKKLALATSNNPAYPIVIYCHERCWLSWNASKRAISYGYKNVYWYPDGIEGWRAAGHPTVVGQPIEPQRKTARN
jgi:PQQ-dependent catabolism-associated CXXCW motif protein